MSMPSYIEFVESMASEGKNQTFFNSGPIHAAIVMSRIFKHSTDEIKIFSGGFNGVVSNDDAYLEYLEQFLKKGGKLKILVERDLSKKPDCLIFSILNKFSASVEMYRAAVKVIDMESKEVIHFTVGDNQFVRLEVGTKDYTAEVNFGDKVKAAELSDLFDKVWNSSKQNRIQLGATIAA